MLVIVLYTLDEVQELVTKYFQDAECLNEPVKLIFEIELDSNLIKSVFSDQYKFWLNTNTHDDMVTIKRNFHQLANILLLPLELGSSYYWEIRNVHFNIKKEKLTGCATIYLGCAQHEDRKWKGACKTKE